MPSHELSLLGPVEIESIDAFRISIPMTEPFRISSGEVSAKDAVLVRLSHGDAFGWGESSAMAGSFYSSDTPDSCEAELRGRILPSVKGRRFETMGELERHLLAISPSRFATVAVETAAWELLARQRGVSLRRLFGLPDRPIPSGLAVGLYDSVDQLLAAIDRYGATNYQRLKIKIKRGHDVELVAAVRRRLPDFPLFVDANADYTLDDAPIFRQLDAFGLMMFEQPLAREALDDSAALQRQVRTPICIDESAETLDDVRRAIAKGSCRIVNIKIQRVGGYLEALRIVELCAENGVPVWMGTMPELGIGSAQALVLASHPAFQFPTDVEPSHRWYVDDILRPELELRNGCLELPPGPGIGFEVDVARMTRFSSALLL